MTDLSFSGSLRRLCDEGICWLPAKNAPVGSTVARFAVSVEAEGRLIEGIRLSERAQPGLVLAKWQGGLEPDPPNSWIGVATGVDFLPITKAEYQTFHQILSKLKYQHERRLDPKGTLDAYRAAVSKHLEGYASSAGRSVAPPNAVQPPIAVAPPTSVAPLAAVAAATSPELENPGSTGLHLELAQARGELSTVRAELAGAQADLAAAHEALSRLHTEGRKVEEDIQRRVRVAGDFGLLTDGDHARWTRAAKRGEREGREVELSLPAILGRLEAWMAHRRLDFSRATLGELAVALDSHMLLLLTGPPGCGKTTLVREVGAALGAEVHTIAVRPNWSSPTDLFGYLNDISGRPMPGAFTTAVRDAELEPARLHLVLMDEMNLAPVENYLADYLSAVEHREAPEIDLGFSLRREDAPPMAFVEELWRHLRSDEEAAALPPLLQKLSASARARAEAPAPSRRDLGKLELPPNLRVIGTVNSDHTVRNFSPRLVDRSVVVRLGGSAPRASTTAAGSEPEALRVHPRSFAARRRLPAPGDGPPELASWLTRLEEPLKGFGRDSAISARRRAQCVLVASSARRMLALPAHEAASDAIKDIIARLLILPRLTEDAGQARGGKRRTAHRDALRQAFSPLEQSAACFAEIERRCDEDPFNYWA